MLIIFNSSLSLYASEDYLHKLVKKATQEALHLQPYWKLLLHYEKTLLGWESEVDSDGFFLAKDGKTNPESELITTLRKFFEKVEIDKDTHPQCRFVARFRWLNQRLNFDKTKIRFQECPLYQKWMELMQPKSVSLIFPSYFLEQPASIFGHTLLRINSQKNEQLDLLNYIVNYAAKIEDKDINPVSYIFQGVFGGFKGVFSMAPYYALVTNYNDIEARDIWEYDLSLNELEIIRLLNHLWEFRGAYFDYYFFKENCSYHLLSLLEIARPKLKLREKFTAWTIPVDSIKVLISNENILKNIRFRPSRRRELENNIQFLKANEKEVIQSILATMTFNQSEMWYQLPENRKFLLLNTLNHYCLLVRSEKSMRLRDEILLQMSQLNIDQPPDIPVIKQKSPDKGHDSFLIATGAGRTNLSGPFQTLLLRPSLHDMLSNDIGYMPYGSVEFFKTDIRHYSDDNRYFINRMDFLNITSLNPSNFISTSASWELDIGIQSVNRQNNTFKPVRFIESGIGLSYEITTGIFYSMAGMALLDGVSVSTGDHVTPYIKIGALYSISERLKTQLILKEKFKQQKELQGNLGVAFYLSQNQEIRCLYQIDDIREQLFNEAYQCQYGFYF